MERSSEHLQERPSKRLKVDPALPKSEKKVKKVKKGKKQKKDKEEPKEKEPDEPVVEDSTKGAGAEENTRAVPEEKADAEGENADLEGDLFGEFEFEGTASDVEGGAASDGEEEAAEVIKAGKFTKPFVIYIAGVAAPEGQRFSHASAIVERGRGSVKGKVKVLREAGGYPVETAKDIAPTLPLGRRV